MTIAASITSRGAWDSIAAEQLAARLSLPAVVAFDSVGSTLDVAHALAADGAPNGTLVLAEEQTAGRGRSGRRWSSGPAAGIWLTLIERALDPATLSLLALRLGLAAAEALAPFADGPVGVKWPNDLYSGPKKLAGILAEARWRDGAPEWVAIGMGVNVRPPDDVAGAGGLCKGVARLGVLESLIPALRTAAARMGHLDGSELAQFARRDVARGRQAVEPGAGTVEGVAANGELLLRAPDGTLASYHSGSLVFAEAL